MSAFAALLVFAATLSRPGMGLTAVLPKPCWPITHPTPQPQHPPLLLTIQRHLPLPATHRMQVEMAWLTTIQDSANDVRCQPRHAEHLADPTDLIDCLATFNVGGRMTATQPLSAIQA